jgi:hypothetical protein
MRRSPSLVVPPGGFVRVSVASRRDAVAAVMLISTLGMEDRVRTNWWLVSVLDKYILLEEKEE